LRQSYGPLRKILDVGLLTLLSIGALFAGARAELIPHDRAHGVAVVFAPWTAAGSTLMQAVGGGGRFVRFGGLPFIAVVMPDDGDYADRMLHGGAWLVLDPRALAACSVALSSVAKTS
jgi:hypothetical protein